MQGVRGSNPLSSTQVSDPGECGAVMAGSGIQELIFVAVRR